MDTIDQTGSESVNRNTFRHYLFTVARKREQAHKREHKQARTGASGRKQEHTVALEEDYYWNACGQKARYPHGPNNRYLK